MLLKAAFTDNGLLRKITFTLVISFSLLCVSLFLWYIGIYLIYQPANLNELMLIASTGSSSFLKSLQLVQSIGLFILPPFVLAYLWSTNTLAYLKLNKSISAKTMVWIMMAMVVVIPFINMMAEWNQNMALPSFMKNAELWMKTSEEKATGILEKFMNVSSLGGLTFNLLLMAALPALGEELFFRGIIQNIFSEKWGKTWGIWLAAIVFSAIHFQFYGFFPRLFLGVFLGYLLVWSGSLWLPIVAHFINNALAVIFYYLKSNNYIDFDIDTVGVGKYQWIGVVCLLLFVGVVWLLIRSLTPKRKDL